MKPRGGAGWEARTDLKLIGCEKMKIILEPWAYPPTRGHSADAGLDLRSPDEFEIPAGSSAVVDTGVHILIPEGFCGLLVSKSGLNVNHDLQSTGLIDAGYTGTVTVKLYNFGWQPYKVHKGDKISQIVILPIHNPPIMIVDSLDGIETERGDNGFGSTGR